MHRDASVVYGHAVTFATQRLGDTRYDRVPIDADAFAVQNERRADVAMMGRTASPVTAIPLGRCTAGQPDRGCHARTDDRPSRTQIALLSHCYLLSKMKPGSLSDAIVAFKRYVPGHSHPSEQPSS